MHRTYCKYTKEPQCGRGLFPFNTSYIYICLCVPQVSKDLLLKIKNTVLQRTVDGMQQEGVPYAGKHIGVIVDIFYRVSLHHLLFL